MVSIQQIKGSDGTGNANVATVQSSRAPAASTIIVDTVLGINGAGFMGSMGTPHTFIDPVTSEEITVISEATCVDFAGHVDGSNLEIDDIAPGYTDAGSEVGDIVIIRPTTQWSDHLAETLEVTHADDGSLKDNIVAAAKLLYGKIRSRQGSSASNWGGAAASGNTTYDVSDSDASVQVGTKTLTAQSTTITFPTAFVNVPWVSAVPYGSGGIFPGFYIVSITNTGFVFVSSDYVQTSNISWMAVGT